MSEKEGKSNETFSPNNCKCEVEFSDWTALWDRLIFNENM